MNEICIVCVAFGERYVHQQERLKQSIKQHCPDVDILFWTDELPEGSKPFKQSLYGFKVHAVQAALNKGYKKIIFLDPACIVNGPIDYYFSLCLPVVAAKDDNRLINHIGTKAVLFYSKPVIPDNWHLVGGSLYVFDFTHPCTEQIFLLWKSAEKNGIFGSQHEQSTGKINKHRNDESCMAMSLYCKGYEPVSLDIAKYCNGSDSIIDKKHFK